SGPNVILDGRRSGGETPSFPGLFQSTSHARRLGGTGAGAWRIIGDIKLCFVPVAAALSRTLSNTHRCVISGIRHRQAPEHKEGQNDSQSCTPSFGEIKLFAVLIRAVPIDIFSVVRSHPCQLSIHDNTVASGRRIHWIATVGAGTI